MDLLRRDRRSDHTFGGDLDGADLPRGIHRIDVIRWLGLHPWLQAAAVGPSGCQGTSLRPDRSLREIADELAKLGYLNERGAVFSPPSIASMLA